MAGSYTPHESILDTKEPSLLATIASGLQSTGRPTLWYHDVCKADFKDCHITPELWEDKPSEHNIWRQAVIQGMGSPGTQQTAHQLKKEGIGMNNWQSQTLWQTRQFWIGVFANPELGCIVTEGSLNNMHIQCESTWIDV